MESYLNHGGKPLSFFLITDSAFCFLSATLILKRKTCIKQTSLGWAMCTASRDPFLTVTAQLFSNTGQVSHFPGLLLSDRLCFKGLRVDYRWVSSPSCVGHLDIAMAIILPETKIKGRTGWTESVAQNSETERPGCAHMNSDRSCPKTGEVEKQVAQGWGTAQIQMPWDCVLGLSPS